MRSANVTVLLAIYAELLDRHGSRHWWPAETPFEMAVGAILTQNTAWTNVERAISGLREAGVLTPAGVAGLAEPVLQQLIRPAGFFRQKAARLQFLANDLLSNHDGRLELLLAGDMEPVRQRLLGFSGIGPETADSILLYAGGHASFVVDAYTRRLFSRLGFLDERAGYEPVRRFFMDLLPPDPPLFNEYHALIVEHCKVHCRKQRPRCLDCPLRPRCRYPAAISPQV